jgi:hypothetical protein
MLDRTQLLPLLDAYLDSSIPLFELRGRFYSGDIRPNDEVEEGLYQAVSMHLAMYTAGTWPEDDLKAAIRWHIGKETGADVHPPIPMFDRQWMDIMASGMAPWPLKVEELPLQD